MIRTIILFATMILGLGGVAASVSLAQTEQNIVGAMSTMADHGAQLTTYTLTGCLALPAGHKAGDKHPRKPECVVTDAARKAAADEFTTSVVAIERLMGSQAQRSIVAITFWALSFIGFILYSYLVGRDREPTPATIGTPAAAR